LKLIFYVGKKHLRDDFINKKEMVMSLKSTMKQKGIHGIALPLIMIISWEIISRWKIISPAILPPPAKIVSTFISLLKDGVLIFNLKTSLVRVTEGFLIGTSAGLVLGILMGLSKTIEKMVGPLFHAIRQVPRVGWIPLIIIWFGIGEISKIVFISMGAFFPTVLNTFQGIRSVGKEYIEVAQVFEYNQIRLLQKVILPAALPSIFTGVRFSLSVSWMMVVAAELFMATSAGIGNMLAEGREHSRMDIVIVGIIVIGIIGLFMNQFVGLIETRLLRWRKIFIK
jgi:sulfonate transport system permease protein